MLDMAFGMKGLAVKLFKQPIQSQCEVLDEQTIHLLRILDAIRLIREI